MGRRAAGRQPLDTASPALRIRCATTTGLGAWCVCSPMAGRRRRTGPQPRAARRMATSAAAKRRRCGLLAKSGSSAAPTADDERAEPGVDSGLPRPALCRPLPRTHPLDTIIAVRKPSLRPVQGWLIADERAPVATVRSTTRHTLSLHASRVFGWREIVIDAQRGTEFAEFPEQRGR
jgi:hypothetical protein